MSPFRPVTLFALITLGLVTFILGLVLAAFSGELFGEKTCGHSGYSRSLVGHHAFLIFLKERNLIVAENRSFTIYGSENNRFPLLLLEPVLCRPLERRFEKESLDRYDMAFTGVSRLLSEAYTRDIPVVVSLPKYRYSEVLGRKRWVYSVEPIDEEVIETVLNTVLPRHRKRDIADEEARWLASDTITNPKAYDLELDDVIVDIRGRVQLLARSPYIRPILECDEGVLIGAVITEEEWPELYLVSDPDLYNNLALDRGDHAAVMYRFLHGHLAADGVMVNEASHGFTVEDGIVRRALTYPIVLVVIHIFLAMGLAAWAAVFRFGKPEPPPAELPPGKRLLIENTAKLLVQANEPGYAVRNYLDVILVQTARRHLAREGTSQKDLIPRLVNLSRRKGAVVDLERLVKRARNRSMGAVEAMRVARKIHAWEKSME